MEPRAYVFEKAALLPWLEGIREKTKLVGPVEEEGFPCFREILSLEDLLPDYGLTMLGPQQVVYTMSDRVCTIRSTEEGFLSEPFQEAPSQVLFGVRSCDLHGLLVLDKVFLRNRIQDPNYRLRRENTLVIGLHCRHVHPQCFCASMGTGPLFEPKETYDILLTDLGELYLAETLGARSLELMAPLKAREAERAHFEQKARIGKSLLSRFTKALDTSHVVESLLRNQDHPVFKTTADTRCLNCTNCTMVCPTCFCYGTRDQVRFDLTRCERRRYKDSCQELHFAGVHGGNFRSTRMARLRQFVTHKLATWWEQFGCFGCVGCGRCMTWCPTKIDLTEMAKVIMASEEAVQADARGR
jgi:sulfhydrogenase subunit beta (sulfur reductase)